MRTAAVLQNATQWSKMDVLKLLMCSIIILQCIDISNGRAVKSFTSIPALYYSYRLLLEGEKLSLAFTSITTPLMLYWLLEAIATFASMDIADLILYVALKVCLIEVLRVKMAEHDSKSRANISTIVDSPQCSDMTSSDIAMDVTQHRDIEEASTLYHTISAAIASSDLITQFKCISMDMSPTPTRLSPLTYSSEHTSVLRRSLKQSGSCCTTQTGSAANTSQNSQEGKEFGDWMEMYSGTTHGTLMTGEARTGKAARANWLQHCSAAESTCAQYKRLDGLETSRKSGFKVIYNGSRNTKSGVGVIVS
ncbi:hypothetical protein Y032_0258g460 [Ancylostoma ceylanicum]|uniref:Uncharacterized protein n=1 Tax=Ancylostoma ceylanicum TaxID=53326 RepID=A0A016SBK5_9BILA|nr:hypothetical protein Y032_0258g460 [Ancylostoma ceylanicum]